MSAAAQTLAGLALVSLALVFADVSHAQDRELRLERQMAAAVVRQAQEAEGARVARQRWESERRRSAAHARMPDTMYASTPSAPAAELSCPVVTDDDMRRAVQGWGDEVSSSPFSSADGLASRDGGVFRAPPQGVLGSSWLSGDDASAESPPQDAWSATVATASNVADTPHLVPLFPSASDAALQGFVRVINHSGDSGEVQIDAVDDTGVSYGPLTLSIDGATTVHFNSNDLEGGNTGKGLTGSTGAGEGDWRLTLTSDLDVEVLSYIRTTDGFLTAMHDLAPVAEGEHRIAIFNPGSNAAQVSRLRLINPGEAEAQVTIEGVDDRGASPGSAVQVNVAAGATQTLTAAELESGGTGMTGALGDGAGKWQLTVKSEASIHALSLLSSPTGHLTNLSTAPSNLVDGVHEVALFPPASDASGRQGFVRVINRSESTAEITIGAHDETDWEYEPLTLSLDSGQVAHFNSDDLEQGNAGKGLTGSTGAGEGDWRLALSSDADIEVLSYIRTTDGFLTAMHDVAPVSGTRHRVAIFNPGSNTAQVSRLRLVNAGEEAAEVTIAGTDDGGMSPGSDVFVTVPAGATRTYTAQELESGAEGLGGSLGDGAGKWRLDVTSGQPIRVLSLLSSPTGHLTNLSTAPQRGAGPVETAEEVFRTLISGPILQTKCINCHVEGGVSGNTRLVFVTDADADHMATNLSVFEAFLAEVEDGADLILNKVQGVSHGGGIQLASGTEEFLSMERFLGLLEGEEVGSVAITPANLFDGVKMASRRNILWRAAIIFAGRIPTDQEYQSIIGASADEFRAAIRNLMQGPEFHEFLTRGANDRLLTDRRLTDVLMGDGEGFYVELTNRLYRLWQAASASGEYGEYHTWRSGVNYGAGRAPVELIAHVVESDRPYTEILTADYVMANPPAAEAYGAVTEFENPQNVHEFRPSEIARYYRSDDSKVVESVDGMPARIVDAGNLATDYPHAGVLNTHAFLNRYPTTATNRNRARSRWTYYHFLGLDVEKSAPRTTDPEALADTKNPTMNNPACTVCHAVLDPIAGAFQNYGDDGYYRDQWGGVDSLDGHYKEGAGSLQKIEVEGDAYQTRQTIEQTVWLEPGSRLSIRHYQNNGCGDAGDESCGRDLRIDDFHIRDLQGRIVDRIEWSELDESCEYDGAYNEGSGSEDDHYQWWGWSCYEIPVELAVADAYVLEISVWADQSGDEVTWFELGASLYQYGDTWYRAMRSPGFDGELVPDADHSLQWLAERVVTDQRFAEATVKFWWPAIMGREIAGPPEDESDADFAGKLLGSAAQHAEVLRLARGFRRGFGAGPHNLKDLLVEMVMSPWFRAAGQSDGDAVRAVALRDAGARRLLTPEELAAKTAALTGFQLGRSARPQAVPHQQRRGLLTSESGYRLLYGGIDSEGITDRAREMTPIMASVVQSHALESSCPIVLREFYLLPDERRQLFEGIDWGVSPVSEFGDTFEIAAGSRSEMETLSVQGALRTGEVTVSLAYLNDFWDEELGDRDILLDRLTVRSGEELVYELEMEEFEHPHDCHHIEQDAFHLSVQGMQCVLEVPVEIPSVGTYEVEIAAWGDQAGDELPRLAVTIESDTERSAGSDQIRDKLAQLYDRLHGLQVAQASEDVRDAYDLFVSAWERTRNAEDSSFHSGGVRCDWTGDEQFYDGIAEHLWRDDVDENGDVLGWDWDAVVEHESALDLSDPRGVARTWVVVLGYILMDYRYLHL